MNVIERIEKIRARLGLTQEALEVCAKLPRNRVSKWVEAEARKPGGVDPKLSHALSVARALGVPLEWLADGDAADEPPERVELSVEQKDVLRFLDDLGYDEVRQRLSWEAPRATPKAKPAKAPAAAKDAHVGYIPPGDATRPPSPTPSPAPGKKIRRAR